MLGDAWASLRYKIRYANNKYDFLKYIFNIHIRFNFFKNKF